MAQSRIYMDYASTTPVNPLVADAIVQSLKTVHLMATQEKSERLNRAKSNLLKFIGAKSGDIIYTANGTMANNIVFSEAIKGDKKQIVTSSVEHPSINQMLDRLAKEGYEVIKLPCDEKGLVDLSVLEKAITNKTGLISIMMANNEIGTIQPIKEIGAIARALGVFFHVDAIQALGKLPIDVDAMQVDAMSFSAHKVFGPKGIGALYVREGIWKDEPNALYDNLPYVIGFDKALEALNHFERDAEKMRFLKQRLIEGMVNEVGSIKAIGPLENGHPGIVTFCFDPFDADSLMIQYDWKGVAVSAGSACSSGAVSASHVLAAIGLSPEHAKKCLRFSLSALTTAEEVERVIQISKEIVK